MSAADRPLVVVSNRGPASFHEAADGSITPRRAAGGLGSTLAPLLTGSGATWIAAAVSDDDRAAADRHRGSFDLDGIDLHLLSVDPDQYRGFYDDISNSTLWFLHHGLFDLPREPMIDRRWRDSWAAYRAVNERFAEVAADTAPERAVILVQDYHLALTPALVRDRRPDVSVVHFHHTPFCGPNSIRVLPTDVATELLSAMAVGACGFHADRWAAAFRACCRDVLGREPATFVAPIGPDVADLRRVADGAACRDRLATLDALVGDRSLIVRVDRMELSKNILRGFAAFDELLTARPEWRGRVVFVAYCYDSRQSLATYTRYGREVEAAVADLNDRWATPTWTPVVLATDDDFPRSVAALRRFDVLLVNPVKDGLNLVAKEGALLNERDGVVALSRDAGAWTEMSDATLEVNPYDVGGTSDVLHRALSMSATERAGLAQRARLAAGARSPDAWLADQVAAAG